MNDLRYQNPVWSHYFADPFVLKVGQEYYAYGTGPCDDPQREFPVLRSSDLIHWQSLGGALLRLPDPLANAYWAPEVCEKQGRFFLFYSASTSASDQDQRLRVAVADEPAGPFVDSGNLLMPAGGFSIDASPFLDPQDGRRYIYFASDYETDEPTGTGLSVAPLSEDLLSIAAAPRPVLRASAPWHVYESNRDYKGKRWAQWNCVEGPHVVYREGRYYCFYSGGAWHGADYGVSAAVASHPLGPWVDEQSAEGPRVLKGIPGKVVGPGHNSVVVAPDGKTDVMVYHAWDVQHSARRLCIDPIRWTADGPRVDGPSTEPRTLR